MYNAATPCKSVGPQSLAVISRQFAAWKTLQITTCNIILQRVTQHMLYFFEESRQCTLSCNIRYGWSLHARTAHIMHCLSTGCSAAIHNDGALTVCRVCCSSNVYWWCSHVVRHVYFVGAPLSGVPVIVVGLSAQRLMLGEDFHSDLAPVCTCTSGCSKSVLAVVACAGSVDALLGCSNSHSCLPALAVRLLGSADSRTIFRV